MPEKAAPQVSIIIPVYNTEGYLRRCLDSVLAQTLKEWECVCVDDGSTDGSGAILDEYAAKDARFVVVHQQNGGESAARNAGLDAAAGGGGGGYIGFIDSDDWIEPDTYKTALDAARRTGADIVQWGAIYESKEGPFPHEERPESFFDAVTSRAYFFPNVWNKLFRHEFIKENGLRYEPGVALGEDTLFSLEAYALAKKCFHLNRYLYHYDLTRETSIMHTETYEARLQSAKLHERAFARIEERLARAAAGQGRKRAKEVSLFLLTKKGEKKASLLLGNWGEPKFRDFRAVFPDMNNPLLWLKLMLKNKKPVFAVPLLAAMRLDGLSRRLIAFRGWLKARRRVRGKA